MPGKELEDFSNKRRNAISFRSLFALGVIEDEEEGRDSFPPRNILRPFLDVFPLIHLLFLLCALDALFRISPSFILNFSGRIFNSFFFIFNKWN